MRQGSGCILLFWIRIVAHAGIVTGFFFPARALVSESPGIRVPPFMPDEIVQLKPVFIASGTVLATHAFPFVESRIARYSRDLAERANHKPKTKYQPPWPYNVRPKLYEPKANRSKGTSEVLTVERNPTEPYRKRREQFCPPIQRSIVGEARKTSAMKSFVISLIISSVDVFGFEQLVFTELTRAQILSQRRSPLLT